jgi:hypothetical protein
MLTLVVRQARQGAASRKEKACKARFSLLVWQMGTAKKSDSEVVKAIRS